MSTPLEQIRQAQQEAVEIAVKSLREEMESKAAEREVELKNQIADLEAKMAERQAPVVVSAEVKFDERALNEKLREVFSGDRQVDLASVDCKALAIGGTNGEKLAIENELGRRVIERARENVAILGLIGRKTVSSVDYRELVLRSYPGTLKGVENLKGTNWELTATQKYVQIKMQVAKQYAKPLISREAITDPAIDLMAMLERLLAEEMSRYWAIQVLGGDGETDNLRGILSSKRVSKEESVKDNATRDPDFYPILLTGVTNKLGATDRQVVDTMIDATIAVPTIYLANSKFVMNRRTLGVLRKIRIGENDNRPLLQFEQTGFTLIGFPVVLEDYMPDVDEGTMPIIFGDLSRAFCLVDIDDEFLVDPYSYDGAVCLKSTSRKGELVQNNDAIVVVFCGTSEAA